MVPQYTFKNLLYLLSLKLLGGNGADPTIKKEKEITLLFLIQNNIGTDW